MKKNKRIWNADIPLVLLKELNDINQLKVMSYICFKDSIKRYSIDMKFFTYDLSLQEDDVKKAIKSYSS